MALDDDLRRIAEVAVGYAGPGEDLAAVIPTEPLGGQRIYLCAFSGPEGQSWLAFDPDGNPVTDRRVLRDAVSIAAMCELAEESAGGGKLPELRAELATLRETERPEGIEEAEEAALSLEQAIGGPPVLATPAYLDAVGAATLRLERALGNGMSSPFAEAMKAAGTSVEALVREVEAGYKGELT
jgi:hypothetical protein